MAGTLNDDQAQKFKDRLEKRRGWFGRGRKQWSFAHHSTLFVSIICTAGAAVIPQLSLSIQDEVRKNWTSVLAGLAAVLLSLSTAGHFERKWRANRISKGKAEQLTGELIGREPNTGDIDRLNQIELEHDRMLLGD